MNAFRASRFLIVSALLLSAMILPAATKPSDAKQPFQVKSFPPEQITRGGQVVITFTSDVVTSADLQTTRTAQAIVSFDPSLEGFFEWRTTRQLRFVPRQWLKPCTRYTARVSPLLRDARGRALEGKNEFKFNTPPLSLDKAEQKGFQPEFRAVIELSFSDEVVPAELHKYLTLSCEGHPLHWTLESDVKTAQPRIVSDPVSTDSLSVHLEAGMPAAGGPLGIQAPEDRPVPLVFKLLAQQMEANWNEDKVSLQVHFSQGVRLDNARDHISISPAVPFELSDTYEGSNELSLSGPFKPLTRYTVTVRKGLEGTNDSFLLRDATLSTWVPAMKPFLSLQDAGGHLSTQGRMKLRVRSAGLASFQATASRVYDNNLVYYINKGGNEEYNSDYNVKQLGREIASKEIIVKPEPGAPSITEIDLHDLLGANPSGAFSFSVEGKSDSSGEESDDSGESRRGRRYSSGGSLSDSAVISISNLGIVAKRSATELVVWVAELDSAKPAAGVHVAAYTAKNQPAGQGDTDANGFVVLRDIPDDPDSKPQTVIATAGGEVSYLNLRDSLSGAEDMQSEGRDYLIKGYEAFLSPERGAYRPGETAHLFGFVRGRGVAQPAAAFPLQLVIKRPDGKELEPRIVTPTTSGSLVYDYAIPSYAPTGLYTALLRVPGDSKKKPSSNEDEDDSAAKPDFIGETEFFVEEFLPNRLKVTLDAPDKRFSTSEPLSIMVKAEEMFGQPAAGKAVDGVATFKAIPFQPKEFKGFAFGVPDAVFSKKESQIEEATVADDGTLSVTVEYPGGHAPAAVSAKVQITVKDTGGRGVTSLIERTIDPVPYYIGLKTRAETFPQPGKESAFDIVAVRPDGGLLAGNDTVLTASIGRVTYNSVLERDGGSFHYTTKREVSMQTSFTIALKDGRGVIAWTPPDPGSFMLTASNAHDGPASSLEFYVSSPRWSEQPWSLAKPEHLDLVADKALYAPGDTARILVKSPFAGTLLLSYEQDHVLTTSLVEMTENTREISIPVTAEEMPNFYCVASVLRPVKPSEKWLPHRAFGMVNLPVSADSRRLAVEVKAPKETRPLSDVNVKFQVSDAATSSPAPAELTVWAVDEGILTLTDFKTPDPMDFFYGARKLMVSTADFFSDLMPDLLATVKPAVGGGDEGASKRRQSPISAERVKPVALWLGTVKTDAKGSASALLKIPQFMGRLRVMAVAADGAHFGAGDANLFVRSPVMVKENLPRFLAPGDHAMVPFTAFNNTDKPNTISVSVETTAPLHGNSHFEASVAVASRGSAISLVPFDAPPAAGVTTVRFSGKSDSEKYEDQIEIPVRPAAPYTHTSGYEPIAAGKSRTIQIPGGDFMPGTSTGTLVISALPTLNLAGGLKYVAHYPYGCVEQTVSSVFPLLYLGDLAAQIEPNRYSGDALQSMVQAGIDRLMTMQTADGGFSMWPGGREPWPWGSAYAAHFLAEAKKAGYEVPDETMRELMGYLQSRLAMRPETADSAPAVERAYICYILALAGKKDLERMEKLYEMRDELTLEGRALLASAYLTSGHAGEANELLNTTATYAQTSPKKINRKAVEAPAARDSGGILASPVRERAILLSALTESNPASADAQELVKQLEDSADRANHCWGTTQENAFALWALGRYAKHYATRLDSFEGHVKLNGGPAMDFSSSAPLTVSAGVVGARAEVEVAGKGEAFAYWTIEGVPAKADTTTVSKGMSVTRRYTDRAGNQLDPMNLEQGKFVVAEIDVDYSGQLDNVVIEDLLPAGLEIENPNLSTAEKVDDDASNGNGKDKDRPGFIVQRTEARDDRMIIFADLSGDGSSHHLFRYGARAVTAGKFALPQVQASCMYDPEIQARGSGGMVRVTEKKK